MTAFCDLCLKFKCPLWLFVVSRHSVPISGRLNLLVFSICNDLALQYIGCVLVMRLGALVLCITQCVRDDEDTIVFVLVCFMKKQETTCTSFLWTYVNMISDENLMIPVEN